MFPGGYIAQKFGAVRLLSISVLITSILTILTPVVVKWGLAPFLILRALCGIVEGPNFPAMIMVISKWSPKLQRSRITSFIYTGIHIGAFFGSSISGILCNSDFWGGWPAVFYIWGLLGCVWFLFWVTYVYETPYDHPNISQEELSKFSDTFYTTNKSLTVPWKHILTSVPVWICAFANFGQLFGFYMLLTEMPTYLFTILHFNIKKSGALSYLPNLALSLGGILSPFLADSLRTSGRISITSIRKIFNSIGGFSPGICLLIAAFSGCDATLIVAIITFGLFLGGFMYSGCTAAVVDMTPDFSGVTYGLINTIGNSAGIIAPTVVGQILLNGATVASWRLVFIITTAMYFVTTAAFALIGSSELQHWGIAKSGDNVRLITDEEKK